MSVGRGRPTEKKAREPAAKSSRKTTTGTRDFARRTRAAERKTARKRTVRRKAAARAGASMSPIALARGALARIPTAALVCALVAFLNAVSWAQITPSFQGADEADHFAYVQGLVEDNQLPSTPTGERSQEETLALQDLHYKEVRFQPNNHLISSSSEQRKLEHDLAQPSTRSGGTGGANVAASEPPLYYALEAIPYVLGSSGSILDRIQLMRWLSAAMGGLTALFVFLFLREALPASPWAWTVGGLGAALAPMMGLASGVVNPDALLFTVSAALFYCLARAFQRGLTQRLAIAIGVLIAAGLLSKLTFIGLAPGAALGLILLARREAKRSGPSAYYRSLAPGLLIAASPVLLYAFVNLLSNRPAFGIVSGGVAGLTGAQGSLSGELSYIWQVFLPRLPGMHNYFPGIFTTEQIWLRNTIGLYGWSDTVFPTLVWKLALIPAALVFALCVRELARRRGELRQRVGELAVYAVMSLGVLALVGAAGYPLLGSESSVTEFTEPRYLLPMLALWGAVLALAARGAGRRWGPAVGALLVVLVLAHDIFSQLQDIARYYA